MSCDRRHATPAGGRLFDEMTFAATDSDALSVGKLPDGGRPRRHLRGRGRERPVSRRATSSTRPGAELDVTELDAEMRTLALRVCPHIQRQRQAHISNRLL